MGPGRYGPVLLQRGGVKVESEKTRLQAMRVRDDDAFVSMPVVDHLRSGV
jgi:hypothetical protein